MKSKNCWYVKYWGGGTFTKAGIPDLLVCCNGYFLGIEIKAKNGRLSEIQKYEIEKIRKSGGISFALYPKDFDDFKFLIEELKKDAIQS